MLRARATRPDSGSTALLSSYQLACSWTPKCPGSPCEIAPRHAGICPKYPFPRIRRLHFGQGLTTSACFCEAATGQVRCVVTVSRHFATAGSMRPKFNSELCRRQNASKARSVTEVSITLSSPTATHLPTSTVVTPKSFATRPHEYLSFLLHTAASVSASIPGRIMVPCQ
jgi:hypothetical protein